MAVAGVIRRLCIRTEPPDARIVRLFRHHVGVVGLLLRRFGFGLPLGRRLLLHRGIVVVAVLEPAVIRREHERCGFPLLPREVLASHQVDGRVEDRIGLDAPVTELGEFRERQVVIVVEAGERLRVARARGAEERPDQAVTVKRVQRELVQVHLPRHERGQATGDEQHQQEPAQHFLRPAWSRRGLAGAMPRPWHSGVSVGSTRR